MVETDMALISCKIKRRGIIIMNTGFEDIQIGGVFGGIIAYIKGVIEMLKKFLEDALSPKGDEVTE